MIIHAISRAGLQLIHSSPHSAHARFSMGVVESGRLCAAPALLGALQNQHPTARLVRL